MLGTELNALCYYHIRLGQLRGAAPKSSVLISEISENEHLKQLHEILSNQPDYDYVYIRSKDYIDLVTLLSKRDNPFAKKNYLRRLDMTYGIVTGILGWRIFSISEQLFLPI